ncbi:MAG TPA: CHAT domain-containing protein [Cyanobacteria bacterium UBA8803]|nr:CHAT domain-containing protein [Cyanobacteria bacterium UBA9273]HBL61932.1 CHAT domain-containing protein [Cyanobacteria bacterium UBA8803]
MEILTIYLSAVDAAQFKVIARSKVGQAEADSRLPFFETADRWRTTLIKALEVNEFRSSAFQREGEQEWMVEQELLTQDGESFHPAMLDRIGQAMYESLFPVGGVRDVLQRAIAHAEDNSTQLHIQLEFNAEITKHSRLPDYPWELAHDRQKFLAHHQVRFSRHIAHGATIPNLLPVQQLNVLLVSSAASDVENKLLPLSKKEQKAVLRGLEKAQAEGHVRVDVLETASLNQLRIYLTEHQGNQAPHVFHFDGHGFFGRRCNISSCRTIHGNLSTEKCQNCGVALPEPQGYLLFETQEDEPDYVSAKELGELLQKSSFGNDSTQQRGGVAVAVLSACKSSMALGGESVFNGVAQQLISHRIPAVVAMQYTIRVDAATQFSEQFYRSLGCKNSLATAISQAQEAMGGEGNQWYRPVLYLRWEDNEGGQLFGITHSETESSSLNSPICSDFRFPLKLTAPQRKQLRVALMSAFPERDNLALLFEDDLGVPLNQIVNVNNFYEKVVADAIKWAESDGKISVLIEKALYTKLDNLELQGFVKTLSES